MSVFTVAARRALVVIMSKCPSVLLSFLLVTFSRPLIGQKSECCIAKEVIKVDELDKGNISAALGKAELSCATLRNKPTQKMSPP